MTAGVLIEWTTLDRGDEGTLAADELDRAGRFRDAEDRRRFVAARTWLRRRLADATGAAPERLEFRYGVMGKPALAAFAGTQFNLSHSGDMAVLAMAGEPVGIDVERIRPGVYDRDAAGLILTDGDLDVIDEAADRDAAFVRAWTRKEAYAKVGGAGLDRRLGHFSLGEAGLVARRGVQVETVDLGLDGVVCALGAGSGTTVRVVGRT